MKKKLLLALFVASMLFCSSAGARKLPAQIYMFGVAASFTDTIVHFTDVQQIDSAWINQKNNFLLERQEYSYQLRSYLEQQQQMPHRTCIVFYAFKKKDIEKKYQKMIQLYTKSKDGLQHFDVRHLSRQDFAFKAIDASDPVEEVTATQ